MAAQGGASRVSGLASDQQQFDSYTIYELFTSSVVALLSYRFVRDHAAVALNYRTFASKPTNTHEIDVAGLTSLSPHWLTSVDVSNLTFTVWIMSLQRPNRNRSSVSASAWLPAACLLRLLASTSPSIPP
jgi:hypothetical protein